MLGGSAVATLLWVASGLLSGLAVPIRLLVLTVATIMAVLRDLRVLRFKLPQNRRQVPREIFERGPFVAAAQFGFELGTGVRTYLPSTGPYLVALGILLLDVPLATAIVIGASFGLGRAILAWLRFLVAGRPLWDARFDQVASSIPAHSVSLYVVGLAGVWWLTVGP